MREHEIRDAITFVEAEVRSIHEAAGDAPLSDDEQARFDEGMAFINEQRAALDKIEQRKAELAALADLGERTERTAPNVIIKGERDLPSNPTMNEVRDAAFRSFEARLEGEPDGDRKTAAAHALIRSASRDPKNRDWVRDIQHRSTEVYESAFLKVVTGRNDSLSSEERAALSHTTAAQGGAMVPTHLDPSIILTNTGTTNAYRAISRVVSLTNGSQWNGISSAGVSASFDAVLTEVSDDSPTVASPTVPTHKAQAFAQATVEAIQDIGNLPGELSMLFADAKDRLEESKFSQGTGTNQPTGIFTAIGATAGSCIAADTQGSIGGADIWSMYEGLGQRWRGRSVWAGEVSAIGEVRRLGTQNDGPYWTQSMRDGVYTHDILGRPTVEDSNAPLTSARTTTGTEDLLLLGDFSNFVIVDKPGSMSVQYIPVMFNTANNLPDGRVGWYVNWRVGSDSVNDAAFRLLYDPTT